MKKLRVFTAFSGYDSQCLALDRLSRDFPEFDYELVGWSEIDPFAIQAHNALYPKAAHLNFGDISKINWGGQVADFDLFTYSFPCQDISNAGHKKGFEKGSGSRSSLLWECRKAIEIKRPKYLLLENVKALVSKKFKPNFLEWLNVLEDLGYKNYWQVLNAKDFGVPQNRERVFCISIRNDGENPTYQFPEPFELDKVLEDVMQSNVEESYFLSDERVQTLLDTMADE